MYAALAARTTAVWCFPALFCQHGVDACCSLCCAGVFAVLAFVQAIVWLNLSASGLVQICVVVGTIFGLKPALLGATVLAWGNSVPDLVNNMAMAKDGFPSMAVAACFASPLFTLLVGMGGALTYGKLSPSLDCECPVSYAVCTAHLGCVVCTLLQTRSRRCRCWLKGTGLCVRQLPSCAAACYSGTILHGGPLSIPVDGPLMVMAGFSIANMVQHLIVVPWVHRYKMKPSLAVITFLFYACFNVVYGLATMGLINIRVPKVSGS
jgi:Ca2+/Na+ antiporter